MLRKAKRIRSPFIDGLLYEFFVECKDIVIPILCKLFNVILDYGIFPENWCNGTIIHVFKKGDKNDVNNYRGITLMSHLSKLFTPILNNRSLNVSSILYLIFSLGLSPVSIQWTLFLLSKILYLLRLAIRKYLIPWNIRQYCLKFINYDKRVSL